MAVENEIRFVLFSNEELFILYGIMNLHNNLPGKLSSKQEKVYQKLNHLITAITLERYSVGFDKENGNGR